MDLVVLHELDHHCQGTILEDRALTVPPLRLGHAALGCRHCLKQWHTRFDFPEVTFPLRRAIPIVTMREVSLGHVAWKGHDQSGSCP